MTRYAFSFDSSACSGCKACQIACKDKHNLPIGVLWRQVYEVTGGGWTRRGNAWVSDVFAYHLSLACNHCEQPICADVCPANAITQRADGIVLIDGGRCLGCRYCNWACPYNAPQYDAVAGCMQKCDLCIDDLDRGAPPACVASCPLRALELIADYTSHGDGGSAVPPLPEPGLTAPALVIKSHPQTPRAEPDSAKLDNLRVTRPLEARDFSLVAFTILAQMAVGAVWILCALQFLLVPHSLSAQIGIAVVASMSLALVASLLHLGTPAKAWRALANWRSSWVSREIVFALLFTAVALLSTGLALSHSNGSTIATQHAALAGIALVYSMASAYRLRTVPAWNTPLTLASFVVTALLLGISGIAAITAGDDLAAGLAPWFVLVVSTLVVAEWAVLWLEKRRSSSAAVRAMQRIAKQHTFAFKTRLLLSFFGIILFGVALLGMNEQFAFAIGFGLLLSSEVIGRYLFYRMRFHEGF